jgi:hypothetical protein
MHKWLCCVEKFTQGGIMRIVDLDNSFLTFPDYNVKHLGLNHPTGQLALLCNVKVACCPSTTRQLLVATSQPVPMPVLARTKASSQLSPHGPFVQLPQVTTHNNTANYVTKLLHVVFFEGWFNVMIGNLQCCVFFFFFFFFFLEKTAPGNYASRTGLSWNYLFISLHLILLLVYLL